MPEIFLTEAQFRSLEKELRDAEGKLARAREAIGEAASKGDLSENAEYDAAREDEQFFMARVAQMREKIGSARILNKNLQFSGEIIIGCKVELEDLDTGEKESYTIVGAGEFDFSKGEVPYNGPFGLGLCGSKEGEEVEIDVPAGKLRYRILSVSMG